MTVSFPCGCGDGRPLPHASRMRSGRTHTGGMTPIAILFWPAAGILLRRLVPAMLLDAGWERWARAAGPGPWPARLALFAAVLAPFASDGVWAPRLMLLAVGYAAGWDAIPRPHHAPRILRAGFGKEGLHNRSVPLPSIRRIGRR